VNKALGDFQTPPALARAVLESLSASGERWQRVLEPTCGQGNFIKELVSLPTPPGEIQGIELQDEYHRVATQIEASASLTRINVLQANVFNLHFQRDLRWAGTGSLLVVGNPPWVTNSQLGSLESDNLPHKTNLKGLRGIEALTGSSNFDVAESIWLKLIKELADQQPTISLLCKTSVARNVLEYASRTGLPISNASIRRIDAKKWFGAAVDACLFTVKVGATLANYECAVYPSLASNEADTVTGFAHGHPIANLDTYQRSAFMDGECTLAWRQGLKHDLVAVMELRHTIGGYRNKSGEVVDIEPEYIYPLLKSSDIYQSALKSPRLSVIVTQQRIGQETKHLRHTAPKLWRYLTAHADLFENRKSSIYLNQPPFCIFGIGDYSFAPYKVAIAGLSKTPRFWAIEPINGRPVMLDDTCYFVPCYSAEQATLLANLLNEPACLDLLRSLIFSDSKRPVTKKLLQRIDVQALLKHVEPNPQILDAKARLIKLGKPLMPAQQESQMTFFPPGESLLAPGAK